MISFKESFIHRIENDCDLALFFDCEFQIYQIIDDKYYPIGPNSVNDRRFAIRLGKTAEIFVEFEGNCSLTETPVRLADPSGGEKMVEIIPDHELSMYDRLRSELVSMMSEYADKSGHESYEEASDLDLDEDDDVPLTPYEFQDMKEEYLRENADSEQPEEIKESVPPPSDVQQTEAENPSA